MRAPSSRGWFRPRLSWFDVVWAAASPIIALLMRDVTIFLDDRASAVPLYSGLSFAFAIIFYWTFRIRGALPSYFSLHDALQIVKAGASTALATCVADFALTRLESIPRSTPIIHGLVLIFGLLAVRAVARLFFANETVVGRGPSHSTEHIIMVGANHVTASFVSLVQGCASCGSRIVAILDDRRRMHGRSVSQIRVVGSSRDLAAIVDEFDVHGVRIHRILVGGGTDVLERGAVEEIKRVCEERGMELDFVPHLPGLRVIQEVETGSLFQSPTEHAPELEDSRSYDRVKRAIDVAVSGAVLVVLLPLMAIISLLVLIDVGSPVLFWQQRLGRNGRSFTVYKIRTLGAPFDHRGRPLSDSERLSKLGKLIRKTHFDECPQLVSVLRGDMSLIGPRPLLPVDQPANPAVRLMVRPGMTGWAQIHGGKDLSVADKVALDEWYVRNMSLGLDLRILLLTLPSLWRGVVRDTWIGDAAHAHRRLGAGLR